MGTLDDAIREHLELKRKRGSSEEELARKEEEAFRPGGPVVEAPTTEGLQEPAREPDEPQAGEIAPASTEAAEVEPAEAGQPEAEQAEVEAAEAAAREVEFDQASSEETVEAEFPAPERPAAPEPVDEWLEDEPPADRIAEGQDPLEEIPDFLEDTAEQERLWFEQKSPKEFDFGD